jgi:hypothetical protein
MAYQLKQTTGADDFLGPEKKKPGNAGLFLQQRS